MSVVLREFDHVAVLVEVAGRLSPRLRFRTVQHLSSRSHRAPVRRREIGHTERDLRALRRRSSILCLIKREVHECAIGPTRSGVTAAGPQIVAFVIAKVEIEAEAINEEADRPIQIRRRQHHSHQTLDLVVHDRIVPGSARQRKHDRESLYVLTLTSSLVELGTPRALRANKTALRAIVLWRIMGDTYVAGHR